MLRFPYASLQTLLCLLSVSSVCLAGVPVGVGKWPSTNITLQMGCADRHFKATPEAVRSQHAGFSGTAWLGYTFNPWFSVQTGYTVLPDTTAELEQANVRDAARAVQVRTKVSLPSIYDFSLFSTLGVAYLVQSALVARAVDSTPVLQLRPRHTYLRPTLGIGISHNLSSHLAVAADYQHLFAQQHRSPPAPGFFTQSLTTVNQVSLSLTQVIS